MSCDCNPIVVGEAGVQGPQGLAGINGTNGTNGINAYTTTTASYTQPSVNSSVSITVGETGWIAIGQYIYVQGAGYYLVTGTSSSTSVTATLKISEASGTITSGKKVTPSGNVVFSGSMSSLSVSGASSLNTSAGSNDTIISASGDANALYVKGSSARVGIGISSPETKLQVIGDVKIGNVSTAAGLIVTNGASVNSRAQSTASGGTFNVYGSSTSNYLISTDPTNNSVNIGTNTTAVGNPALNVNGNTKLGGTLDVTGASQLASLTVTGASSVGSISSSGAISCTGAISGASYQVGSGTNIGKLVKFYYAASASTALGGLSGNVTKVFSTTVSGVTLGDFVSATFSSIPTTANFSTDITVSAKVISNDTVLASITNTNASSSNTSYTDTGLIIKYLIIRASAA